MTEVIRNQAQHLVMQTDESFHQFAERIWRTNQRSIQYRDGSLIELEPELAYSFLLLGLERLLTPEEFDVVYTCVKTAIAQAEEQGVIPQGLVETVATPFDVPARPTIPDKFADEIPEEATVKTYLTGTTSFTLRLEVPDDDVNSKELDNLELENPEIDELDAPEGEEQ